MGKFLFKLTALVAAVVPSMASAAMLYMDPPTTVVQRGDAAVVSVRVDVNEELEECINIVNAVITYPDNIQAIDTSTGNSILQHWIEPPQIDQENNQITFVGAIPNGYCGRVAGDPQLTNVVLDVVFRSPAIEVEGDETALIDFGRETEVYLNDGLGTQAIPDTYGASITLLPTTGSIIDDPWLQRISEDTTPPEPFSIYLERDDSMFDGRYYIVFNTTDKQSGIATYEVMEEPLADQGLFRFGAVGAPWIEARSPYRLRDQTLNSRIFVRATDKAGNEYVATLIPDQSLRTATPPSWMEILAMAVGGLLLVSFAYLLGRLVARHLRIRKQKQKSQSSEETSFRDDTFTEVNSADLESTQEEVSRYKE